MAINTWTSLQATGDQSLASATAFREQLASSHQWISADQEHISYWCAGVNHQAWMLEYRWKGVDAYPLIRRCFEDPLDGHRAGTWPPF